MVVHASAGAAALALLVVLGRRRAWPDRAPAAPLDPAGHPRRRHPVVRLVRLQRRRRAAGQRRRRAGADQHPGRGRGGDARVAHRGAAQGRARHRARRRHRCGRRAGDDHPGAGYVSTTSAVAIGAIAGLVCHVALRLKDVFGTTTPSTSSRCTSSAACSARCWSASSERSRSTASAPTASSSAAVGAARRPGARAGLRGRLLVLLTWLIAMAIQKTIGLRVSRRGRGAPGRGPAGDACLRRLPLRVQQRDHGAGPRRSPARAGTAGPEADHRSGRRAGHGRRRADRLAAERGSPAIICTTPMSSPRRRTHRWCEANDGAQGTRRTRLEITTGPDHVAGVVAALRENAGRPVEVSVHVAEGTP